MIRSSETFIFEYLQRRQPIPGATRDEQLRCAYLEAGVLDSLGLIDLVTEIESRFGIRFENEDFEDDRFRTVGGLIDMIESKRPAA